MARTWSSATSPAPGNPPLAGTSVSSTTASRSRRAARGPMRHERLRIIPSAMWRATAWIVEVGFTPAQVTIVLRPRSSEPPGAGLPPAR